MGWRKMSKFALKLYLQQQPRPKRIIGLDMGTALTGISISCPRLQRTYLLKTLKCPIKSDNYTSKLLEIVKKQKYVIGIIIGKPQYSTESPVSHLNSMQKIIEQISEKLSQNNQQQDSLQNSSYQNLPFCFVDESRTTLEARQKIYEVQQAIRYHGHKHNMKQLEDGIASMKILQRFLTYYNTN